MFSIISPASRALDSEYRKLSELKDLATIKDDLHATMVYIRQLRAIEQSIAYSLFASVPTYEIAKFHYAISERFEQLNSTSLFFYDDKVIALDHCEKGITLLNEIAKRNYLEETLLQNLKTMQALLYRHCSRTIESKEIKVSSCIHPGGKIQIDKKGECIHKLAQEGDGFVGMAFLPNGKVVLECDRPWTKPNKIRILDPEEGTLSQGFAVDPGYCEVQPLLNGHIAILSTIRNYNNSFNFDQDIITIYTETGAVITEFKDAKKMLLRSMIPLTETTLLLTMGTWERDDSIYVAHFNKIASLGILDLTTGQLVKESKAWKTDHHTDTLFKLAEQWIARFDYGKQEYCIYDISKENHEEWVIAKCNMKGEVFNKNKQLILCIPEENNTDHRTRLNYILTHYCSKLTEANYPIKLFDPLKKPAVDEGSPKLTCALQKITL